MTLLELITNCINYTTQDDEELNPQTLEQFKNSTNYMAFIKNALPEINRAIQEIVAWKKLPTRVMEFVNNSTNGISRQDGYTLIARNNLYYDRLTLKLDRPEWEKIYRIFKFEIENNAGEFISPITYKKVGDEIILPKFYGKLYLHYYPRIRLLTEADKGSSGYEEDEYNAPDTSLDLYELGLDDTLCNIVIPQLVKANIWQEVEPEMAQLERNKGLQNLNMLYDGEEEPYQTSVSHSNLMEWGD